MKNLNWLKFYLIFFLIIGFFKPCYSQFECLKRISEEASELDTIQKSTGTGFLILGGVIVTNRHVIDGANDLKVIFDVNGKKISKDATFVSVSKEFDLGVLKVENASEEIFSKSLPYGFSETPMKLGEKIFVLGYPSPNIMGSNIKLTDGLISSNSGFLDDENMYQISAPIQPGNSGSPMFDVNGNIKGVVVASYDRGQLVNYAIKSKYLKKMFNEDFTITNKGSTKHEAYMGPKPVSNIDFRNSINKVSKNICLIVNTSKKRYYEQFKLQIQKFYSKSNSLFDKYNKECSDDYVESTFKNTTYENGLNKNEDEYLKNWVEKYFKDDFSRTLFYTLHTNYNFNSPSFEIDLHNKFDYLQKIGAYENIIEDHDFVFRITTNRINETSFNYYMQGFYSYYFNSVIVLHSQNFEKLRNHMTYIDFLISLNDKVNTDRNYWLFQSAKSKLLVGKAFLMTILNKDFSQKDICQTLQTAKSIYKKTNIFFDYDCDPEKKSGPEYSDQYEIEATKKFEQRQYKDAIELYTKSLELNSNNYKSLYKRGESYFNLGEEFFENALQDYNNALKNSDFKFPHFSIGFIHQRQGKLKQAIIDYDIFLKYYPDYAFALYHKGNCKGRLKDYEGAIIEYDKLIKIEKTLPDGFELADMYNSKAYYLMQLNQYKRALPAVNKAIELDPRFGYIWDTRGELNYKLGNYLNCIKDMSVAIGLSKNSANSYYYRGLAYLKMNYKLEACNDFNLAKEFGKKEQIIELNSFCK